MRDRIFPGDARRPGIRQVGIVSRIEVRRGAAKRHQDFDLVRHEAEVGFRRDDRDLDCHVERRRAASRYVHGRAGIARVHRRTSRARPWSRNGAYGRACGHFLFDLEGRTKQRGVFVRQLDLVVAQQIGTDLGAHAAMQRGFLDREVSGRHFDVNPNAARVARTGSAAAQSWRNGSDRQQRRIKRAKTVLRPIATWSRHGHFDPMRMLFAWHQAQGRDAGERELRRIAGTAQNRRCDRRHGHYRYAAADKHRVRQQHVAVERHRASVEDFEAELARSAGQARRRADLLDQDIRAAFRARLAPTVRVIDRGAVAEAEVAGQRQIMRVDEHVEPCGQSWHQKHRRDYAGEIERRHGRTCDARTKRRKANDRHNSARSGAKHDLGYIFDLDVLDRQRGT